MAAKPHPGLKEQEALGHFVKAAFYLTDCRGAILLLRDGTRWHVASTCGTVPTLGIDDAFDGWLKMALSYGDVVDLGEVMPHDSIPPTGLEPVADEFLVCAAVREATAGLIGVVLMMIPLPHSAPRRSMACRPTLPICPTASGRASSAQLQVCTA
jgi:hypothetical protein